MSETVKYLIDAADPQERFRQVEEIFAKMLREMIARRSRRKSATEIVPSAPMACEKKDGPL